MWDLSEFTKQMPRSYPRHPNNAFGFVHFPIIIDPRPGRGVFGVVHLPVIDGLPDGLSYHHKEDKTGAFFRRLKSIPRIKHLPRLGWAHAKESLPKRCFYNLPTYHDGSPSYHSTLPD